MSKRASKCSKITPNKKSVETRRSTTRWTKEIALKAIQLEEQYYAKYNPKELIIKFPDPPLSEDIVKGFSNSIQTVTFPFPIVPRECIVKLSDDSNIEKAIKEINKIRFAGGKLQAKKNLSEDQRLNLKPEEIDPFTLYFGNLPHSKTSELKIILKNADVQVGQNKRKPKSYAFATFKSFEDALQGFNKCTKKYPPSQFITIRFKRNKNKEIDESSQDSLSVQSVCTTGTITSNNNNNNKVANITLNRSQNKSKRKQKKDKFAEKKSDQIETNKNNSEDSANLVSLEQNEIHSKQNDLNIKIKEEPGVKLLGFERDGFHDDMDGDTDCSESTVKHQNSLNINGIHRRRSSNSVLAISDSEDEFESKMKKPKLLELPSELHGSLREIKDEDNNSSNDDIGDIDLDFI